MANRSFPASWGEFLPNKLVGEKNKKSTSEILPIPGEYAFGTLNIFCLMRCLGGPFTHTDPHVQLSSWLSGWILSTSASLGMLWMERLWQESTTLLHPSSSFCQFNQDNGHHSIFFDSQVGTHDGFAPKRAGWQLSLLLYTNFGGFVFFKQSMSTQKSQGLTKPVSIRHPPVIPWGERRCFFWGIQFLRAETHHLKGSLASMGGNCLVCFTPKIPYNLEGLRLEYWPPQK